MAAPPLQPPPWTDVGPRFLAAFPDLVTELLDPSGSPTIPITQFQATIRAAIRVLKSLSPSLHALAQANESLHNFLTQAFPAFAEAVFCKRARPADIPLIQRCLVSVFRLLVLCIPLEIESLSALLLLLLGGGETRTVSQGLAPYVPVQCRTLVPGGLYQVHGKPVMRR